MTGLVQSICGMTGLYQAIRGVATLLRRMNNFGEINTVNDRLSPQGLICNFIFGVGLIRNWGLIRDWGLINSASKTTKRENEPTN